MITKRNGSTKTARAPNTSANSSGEHSEAGPADDTVEAIVPTPSWKRWADELVVAGATDEYDAAYAVPTKPFFQYCECCDVLNFHELSNSK